MSTEQLQRPQFYEGQYLGAADLAAVIDYARLRAARHSLGAHTWGIVVGLELKEEPSLAGGGAVDVFLQPGYAVDGFGRSLVVTTPYQIPASLFRDENTGRVAVWLRYAEQPTAEPGFGFAVCETEDQHARVAETFEVVVGDRARLERRDEIVVAGQSIDVIEALYAFDENDPLLCDGSVPFQTFPDPGEALWLVPLGQVRWDSAAGQLVETDEDDRLASRAFRRHLGVVAEDLYAADGLIRLRRRGTDTDGTAIFADCAADEQTFDTASGLDLAYDEDKQRARPHELVWIEGHLRLVGDGRLFGGKLEFRDDDGDDDGTPLWIQRSEANGRGGKDLQVLLGTGSDGENRLVVGQLTVDADGNASIIDRVIVQDDGKVGIGTANPTSSLVWPLTIRAIGEGEELLAFEAPDGTTRWHLNQNLGGAADGLNMAETGVADGRLFLQNGGNVGIGTTAPEARLDVAGVRTTSGGSPLGSDLWLRAGNGGDDGRFWVEYGSQAAPMLVLSDRDDPPRLQFQQTGDGDETGPDFSSWIGHARGESSDLAVMNANVGIGTTIPRATLHVGTGSDASLSDTAGYLVLGDVDGLNLVMDDNEIIARSNGALSTLHFQAEGGELRVHNNKADDLQKFVITDAGEVGIGITAPVARLHVRDSLNENASNLSAHVAVFENISTGASADVLALRIGAGSPGDGSNFITFFGGGTIVGRIEGDAGGVAYRTGFGDFAEYLPRLCEEEAIEEGEVVGVVAGKVTKVTDGAHHVMVVTGRPAIVGNMPPPPEAPLYEQVAFLGQVPVKVRGPVQAGDYIVPSGKSDGVGVAVSAPAAPHTQIVGRAWESSDEPGIKQIRAVVGLSPPCSDLAALLQRQDKEIYALRAEVDHLKAALHTHNGLAP